MCDLLQDTLRLKDVFPIRLQHATAAEFGDQLGPVGDGKVHAIEEDAQRHLDVAVKEIFRRGTRHAAPDNFVQRFAKAMIRASPTVSAMAGSSMAICSTVMRWARVTGAR